MLFRNLLVYVMLVAVMFFWGGTWPVGRLLAQEMPTSCAAFLRFSVASIILLAMIGIKDRKLWRPPVGALLPLIFLGATGIFGYSFFFFTGLRSTSAVRAALMVACIPACIFICSVLVLRERSTWLALAGVLVSLSGVSVIVTGGHPLVVIQHGVAAGDLMILGCVASWTLYSIAGKVVMRRFEPLHVVTWSCIFGALLLLPFAWRAGLPDVIIGASGTAWGYVLYLGAPATALGYHWYYRAMQSVGVARSGVFINLVPVFAVLISYFWLGETLKLASFIGGGMAVLGVLMTNASGPRKSG